MTQKDSNPGLHDHQSGTLPLCHIAGIKVSNIQKNAVKLKKSAQPSLNISYITYHTLFHTTAKSSSLSLPMVVEASQERVFESPSTNKMFPSQFREGLIWFSSVPETIKIPKFKKSYI